MIESISDDPILPPDKIVRGVEQLQEDANDLLLRLGTTAFSATQIVELNERLNKLKDTVDATYVAAAELEYKPPFGDEESYRTTFRLFCVGEGKGTVLSIEQIWQHLAKTYDMSAETLDTLLETLDEWASDMELDAKEQMKIAGEFLATEGGYVFAPLRASGLVRVDEAEAQTPIEEASPKPALVNRPDTEPRSVENMFADKFLQYIRTRLVAEGDIRQADIKKAAIRINDSLEATELQQYIDSYITEGVIYKYREGNVALLSLTPKESLPKASREELDNTDGDLIRALDTNLAAEVLMLLCAPKTHYQQKLDAGTIWRSMNPDESRAPTPEEEKNIRTACRLVEKRYKLLTTGQEKIGTGGRVRTNSATSSIRRRSSSNTIFKIGLASQDAKKRVQAKLAEGGIAQVKTLFDMEPTGNDDSLGI